MAKLFFTLLLLALVARAPAAPETALYDGKAADSAHFTVASWGAGTGEDTTEFPLQGSHSLKITMLDLYQGAQLSLADAVPLNLAEPGLTFQITLRPGTTNLHYNPRVPSPNQIPEPNTPDPNADPNANPGDTPPAPDPMGGPPALSPFDTPAPDPMGGAPAPGPFDAPPAAPAPDGAAGGPDGATPGTASHPLIPLVTKIRLVFTLADGRQADILRSIPTLSDPSAGPGWYSISVPLSALKLGTGADAKLKSVTLGGDHYGVFYIGRIRVATDTAPLTAGIVAPASVAPGDAVPLRATVDGGLSMLRYSWNFGLGGSGEDANGSTAIARYQNGGDKTVTLTVSDLDGLKKPVTVTQVIHVAPPPDAAQPGQ